MYSKICLSEFCIGKCAIFFPKLTLKSNNSTLVQSADKSCLGWLLNIACRHWSRQENLCSFGFNISSFLKLHNTFMNEINSTSAQISSKNVGNYIFCQYNFTQVHGNREKRRCFLQFIKIFVLISDDLFYSFCYFTCFNKTTMADDNKRHMMVAHVMHNTKRLVQ